MIRLCFAIVWLASCGIVFPTHAAQPVVILCDDSYPPYSYADSGEAKGIYVEIVREIASRMPGYTVSIQPVPWKRGLLQVMNGEAFGIIPPYYRPHERPYISYSDPILKERLSLVVHERSMTRPREHWPDDYDGFAIGTNAGFSTPLCSKATKAITEGRIRWDNSGTTEQNLLKLNRDRLQGYVNDPASIFVEWERLARRGDVTGKLVETAVLSEEYGHLGITDNDKGRFAFKYDFITQFNRVLATMQRAGTVEAIRNGVMKSYSRHE